MNIAILTACSSRKKLKPNEATLARSLNVAGVAQVARQWVGRVQKAGTPTKVANLYAGRGFQEACRAAAEHGARQFIVSAGLGLRRVDEPVCSYSLTVAPGDVDSIQGKVSPPNSMSSQEWWHHLNQQFKADNPVSRLINSTPGMLFVLALPRSYIELIANDLGAVSDTSRARVRLVGPRSIDENILPRWTDNLMPYDDRLDGVNSTIAGTKSDFPQRAARHFLGLIATKHLSASIPEHKSLVAESLKTLNFPESVRRPRCSDADLKIVIHELWDESGGRVGAGLRLLRDKRQISCEQSRFKRLFWEVGEAKERLS